MNLQIYGFTIILNQEKIHNKYTTLKKIYIYIKFHVHAINYFVLAVIIR